MFCFHKWEEIKRRFTAPSHSLKSTIVYQEDIISSLNKDMFGFTTFELKCNKCGKLKFYEKIGNQT